MLKSALTSLVMASVISIGAIGAVSFSSETAFAKRKGEVPISNWGAARLYSNCMLDSKSKNKSGRTYDRCCSKSLGYCIKCPKTREVGKMCVKSPYRIGYPTTGMGSTSGNDTLAPTRYTPKPRFPAKMKVYRYKLNRVIKN
ncbi:MAG: hypothetical protein GKR97_18620 [Rhizobiaceae bacterium]|nr:hypothetical protein [Rhizobiaceae bacterium]